MVTDANQTAAMLMGSIGSIGQALDVWQVLFANKPATRIVAQKTQIPFLQQNFDRLHLSFCLADFGLLLQSTPSGYADNASMISMSQANHLILYVAKSPDVVQLCKTYEANQDHVQVGIALGYPHCCSQAFSKWSKKTTNLDFTLDAIKQNSNLPWLNNIALRQLDTRLSPHFPCDVHCQESVRVNRAYFQSIANHIPQLAVLMQQRLKSTVLYHKSFGPFILYDAVLKHHTWTFTNVEGNTSLPLYKKLMETKSFTAMADALVLSYQ